MTYYLYHIPGKKVGVTTNLEERVHKQQGYYPGEYEIIETSEDIDFISIGESRQHVDRLSALTKVRASTITCKFKCCITIILIKLNYNLKESLKNYLASKLIKILRIFLIFLMKISK